MKFSLVLALPATSALRLQPSMTVEKPQSRRSALLGGFSAFVAAPALAYTLPDLPYAYDALEPSIDAATMKSPPKAGVRESDSLASRLASPLRMSRVSLSRASERR